MISSLAVALLFSPPQAKWTPGVGMSESLVSVLGAVDSVTDDDLRFDYGVSVLGAYLRPGQSVSLNKTFAGSSSVLAFVGGANSSGDLDIKVTKGGTLIKEDADADSDAAVIFKPVSGAYTITVTLASGRASFVTMALLRDGYGWQVPLRNLLVAGNEVIKNASSLGSLASLKFLDGSNNWCVFGGVVEKESYLQMDQLQLTGKFPSIVGGCDESSSDIDLTVYNSSMKVVDFDDDDDDYPTVVLDGPVSSASVRLYNADTSPSFSMFALLNR